MSGYSNSSYSIGGQARQAEREAAERDKRNARALELAKAHHAAMGPAMRVHMPGGEQMVVGEWWHVPSTTRDVMVAVMADLLDKGVIV